MGSIIQSNSERCLWGKGRGRGGTGEVLAVPEAGDITGRALLTLLQTLPLNSNCISEGSAVVAGT